MFNRMYFANVYFSGSYFEPIDGSLPPVVLSDNPPLVGMVCNFGTMMGRR